MSLQLSSTVFKKLRKLLSICTPSKIHTVTTNEQMILRACNFLPKKIKNCVISGFCHNVDETCSLLGYYAIYSSNYMTS
jgi:hypothetical protein